MTTILKLGSRGADVKALQRLLTKQGVPTIVDGEFGLLTAQSVRYFQSTHLNSKGVFLQGDGEVGPETWWALNNPSGDAQKSGIKAPATESAFAKRYGALSENRREFLRLAFSEHEAGTKEIPDGSNKGGGVNKIIKGFGPAPWCALFISWIFFQVMKRYPNNARQAHVQTGWRTAASLKRTFKKGTKVPMPGDLAVWHFGGSTGHVSIVVAVNKAGTQFNTIGGNEGNRVKLGLRTLANEPQLVGFIDLFDDGRQGEGQVPRTLLSAAEKASALSGANSR